MVTQADLSNCAKEPIHIPESIQPHGYLFALTVPDLMIKKVSANIQELVGIGPDRLVNSGIERLLGTREIMELRRGLRLTDLSQINPIALQVRSVAGKTIPFAGIVHRSDDYLVLELEPVTEPRHLVAFGSFYNIVRRSIRRLQKATTKQEAYQVAAEEVKLISGFDRVMVYEFDADWNGQVVAESKESFIGSFMAQHFPATDIPAQARRLYTLNWLRLIADVNYTPSPIYAAVMGGVMTPLDLSYSVLRSVSPVHIEYLKNMEVGASMSVSVMRADSLWGLIACHHATPKFVNYEQRSACEFLGQMLSQTIQSLDALDEHKLRQKLRLAHEKFRRALESASAPDNPIEYHELLSLPGASGVAIVSKDGILTSGLCPPEPTLRRLRDWLSNFVFDEPYTSSCLGAAYPQAHVQDFAAGLLAVPISWENAHYILWFRQERQATITWAGDPAAAVSVSAEDQRLHPRDSFAQWQEVVKGTCEPWQKAEIDIAVEIRETLLKQELNRFYRAQRQQQTQSSTPE